ncbi:DUF3618 domain-containing protein [uncultured Friedmanniella sp.]|uniref:DUF3618 domain-containing protein n=1 Tax=uncultured Friedmanniella sp. TaxID=335381 RepID=UPI0035C9CAC1
MTEHVTPPPGADATPEELEADLAATRARIVGNVDALAEKVDVKAQAQHKVDDVKAQAAAKVSEVKATAQEKVAGAQEKVAGAQAKVTATTQEQVVERVKALPRPAQLGLAAAPVLLVVLWLVQRARKS